MKNLIVIPARYASTRLPGKPLCRIADKPMIVWVLERAKMAKNAAGVLVATDDERIVQVVEEAGGSAVLTSAKHTNGTERLCEAAARFDADNYINVQGDEPFVEPEDIDRVIALLEREKEASVATLYAEITDREAQNEDCVKIVLSHGGRALYFSRSAIPFARGAAPHYYKHIGLYAYRKEALLAYPKLPRSDLEESEKLEQMRYLQAGFAIYAAKTERIGISVDTPQCLRRAVNFALGVPETRGDLSGIRLLLTDIDGVLSPAQLIFDENGESHKLFNVRDGLGIEVLQRLGITVGVITGRDSPALRKRLELLRIAHARFGIKDKGEACVEVMRSLKIAPEETIYVGDDAPDLAAFAVCGFSCAVGDAPKYIRDRASFALKANGGSGAIREVTEMVLEAKGKLDILSNADEYLKSIRQTAS
ncbi:MAG: 3-deoxy-manno-octulosonate cytidylyltransferase [Helicobacteraceae bacterium]|jgi:3-deoxy-manno-octulosonate cytidylyltransferase (CMP-KDO synthetase)|nr:3-deoxy-manno-octulosonate cytidylyltransferase [Helicobacteraceae bacterium]